MVPTGVLSNDASIKQKTSDFLAYVLSHQDPTGWLGPEVNTTNVRYLWGRSVNQSLKLVASCRNLLSSRYPFFFGATQMVESDPSLASQVIPAMYKFITLANSMLKTGQGLEPWTEARWQEFAITLQWFLYALASRSTTLVDEPF